MFVVLRGRVILIYVTLVLVLLSGGFWLWSWLSEPTPVPRIGLDASSEALIQDLFQAVKIGTITLAASQELVRQLEDGKLDYIVEIEKPTSILKSWPVGELIPVIIVPFFDLTSDISQEQLITLLEKQPQEVLVSKSLAVPTFPWSDQPVQYLSSFEVIERVKEGQAKFGIIPLQHRQPSIKVIPLAGVDPLKSPDNNRAPYPLTRTLYLSRAEKNLLDQIKDRYHIYQGRVLDEIRFAPLATDYADPWASLISLVAVGDIMLDRDVKKEGLTKGWEYIFAEVAPFIQSADLAFANLESPIGDRGHFINMFQAPPEAIHGLTSAGFDVMSLANNHTLDYHIEGMLETMRLLEVNGIDHVGAGRNIKEARAPLIKEVAGVKVGFLSYTEMWFVHAREPISWQATQDEPGVAPAKLDYIVEDVTNLRELVDVVIVTVHWGKEYIHEPTLEQHKLARAAVDAGADLVLGHHPHVLQGIEFYNGGVIAYSLGNFVFDLNRPKTWETMLLEFTLAPTGVLDLKIIPAYIFGVQPRILKGAHQDAVYRQIRHYSLEI